MTELEADLLLSGELTIRGRITTASNATFVCDATPPGDDAGGPSAGCVYKPVRGEQPLWDFPDGTLAGRERASYLLCDALGWGMVPTTVLRDGPYGPGIVQRWIDTTDETPELVDVFAVDAVPAGYLPIFAAQDGRGNDVLLAHADDPRLRRMAVLDLVLNNPDRKGGHVLPGTDGRLYGVDHGICLHADPKLRTVLWGWAGRDIEPSLLVDLAGLAEKVGRPGPLAEELDELLTIAEVEALLGRLQDLQDHPVMPHPGHGRMIPWPPF
ncbi:SCO1664 family protein [Tomitella biformata]|uniref:SCO1664 family protein n=1 Tax=Tomitella biformata TaxID=630403 RepID=UPI000467A6C7|nr:SCO1664 family protein [Tomitella biformata]